MEDYNMESMQKKDKLLLELTKEEAIVLFDWLFRFNEKEKQDFFHDQAEERVLWNMEASLEKVLPEILSTNYVEILSKSRKKVRD